MSTCPGDVVEVAGTRSHAVTRIQACGFHTWSPQPGEDNQCFELESKAIPFRILRPFITQAAVWKVDKGTVQEPGAGNLPSKILQTSKEKMIAAGARGLVGDRRTHVRIQWRDRTNRISPWMEGQRVTPVFSTDQLGENGSIYCLTRRLSRRRFDGGWGWIGME